jgi:hypothetical protein
MGRRRRNRSSNASRIAICESWAEHRSRCIPMTKWFGVQSCFVPARHAKAGGSAYLCVLANSCVGFVPNAQTPPF